MYAYITFTQHRTHVKFLELARILQTAMKSESSIGKIFAVQNANN
jgi:hypothetical protein